MTTRRAVTPGGSLVNGGVTLDLTEAEARAMIAAGDAVARDDAAEEQPLAAAAAEGEAQGASADTGKDAEE